MTKKYSVKQEYETTPLTEGQHHAVLYAMVDVGNQPYNDKKTGERKYWHRFMLMFDFPGFGSDKYTETIFIETFPSLNPSSKGWLGMNEIFGGQMGREFTAEEKEDFDIVPFLGKTFLLEVKQNDKGYMNVFGSTKPTQQIKTERELVFVDITDYENDDLISKLPQFVVQKIQRSEEYEKIFMKKNFGVSAEVPADDNVKIENVPF